MPGHKAGRSTRSGRRRMEAGGRQHRASRPVGLRCATWCGIAGPMMRQQRLERRCRRSVSRVRVRITAGILRRGRVQLRERRTMTCMHRRRYDELQGQHHGADPHQVHDPKTLHQWHGARPAANVERSASAADGINRSLARFTRPRRGPIRPGGPSPTFARRSRPHRPHHRHPIGMDHTDQHHPCTGVQRDVRQ